MDNLSKGKWRKSGDNWDKQLILYLLRTPHIVTGAMPSNPLSTCQPTNFLNRKIDEKPHGWKITDMSETMQIKRLNAFKSTRRHSAIILLPQKCCYYDPALLALVSFPGVMIYFSLSAPDSSLLILSASSTASPDYAMFVIPHNNNTQPGSEHCKEKSVVIIY